MKMKRYFVIATVAGLLMLPGCSKSTDGTANAAPKVSYKTMTVPELEALAKKEDTEAQASLGATYLEGTRGVSKNFNEGLKWTRLAADKGNAMALCNMGVSFVTGKYGAKIDYKEAMKFFQLSAKKGYAEAQYSLGVMHAEGLGVSKNYNEAFKWNKLAAEQGLSYAQNNVGTAYSEGLGTQIDYVRAYMWYNLALANGFESSKRYIINLEQKMTPQQIEQAQKLTREWKPKAQ